MKKLFLLLFLTSVIACKSPSTVETIQPNKQELGLVRDKAMVVSAREEASKIASDIMKQGGNAFDAMVVTEMALAVSYPFAGSLGGGGFMVYRKANGEIGSLDFREKAPKAATKNMYLDEDGIAVAERSQVGALAIGVPGNVAGIFDAHDKLGYLPMDKLLAPVIALARRGYVVTQKQADSFNEYQPNFEKVNKTDILYSQSVKAGDTIKNIALANTLQKIADNGRSEFYGVKPAKNWLN